jgi:hypothetical protein
LHTTAFRKLDVTSRVHDCCSLIITLYYSMDRITQDYEIKYHEIFSTLNIKTTKYLRYEILERHTHMHRYFST